MKRIIPVLLVLIAAAGIGAQESLRRINTGLILDTPFLHQDELPYENSYSGPYGDEHTTYEYDAEGRPSFIRYTDEQNGLPYLDVEPFYDEDGRLARLVYTSYEEEDGALAFVDDFSFSDFGPTGPRIGVMTSDEGVGVRILLAYDDKGRLVEIEEDNAYGEGLFRRERYAWVDVPNTAGAPETLPYAIEIHYPLDGERDRYYLLYDATRRLRALEGVNLLESDPADTVAITGTYYYRDETLVDAFGSVVPVPRTDGTTTAFVRP